MLAKPGALTVRVYLPGGKDSSRYSPSTFSVVDRSKALACSRAVTVALVTTLPRWSFTMTCRSPVAAPWAAASVASSRIRTATERIFIVGLIGLLVSPCEPRAGDADMAILPSQLHRSDALISFHSGIGAVPEQ